MLSRFSHDGETLYSASVDGTIRAWRYRMTKPISTVIVKHGFGVNELIINDAEGWLAYGATDGGTRIIDLQTARTDRGLHTRAPPNLGNGVRSKRGHLAAGDGQGYHHGDRHEPHAHHP